MYSLAIMEHMSIYRNDLSLALIHLTGYRGNLSAIDALKSILAAGRICGSGNSGFVKGSKTAVCFTEMPLSAIQQHVERSKPTKHPYECCGIALSKNQAWARGARPVIYLPDNEAAWIPDEQKWRHVRFELGEVDFSHEREWRSEGNFDLNDIGFYVIVPSRDGEAFIRKELSDIAQRHVIGFLHMDILGSFL